MPQSVPLTVPTFRFDVYGF